MNLFAHAEPRQSGPDARLVGMSRWVLFYESADDVMTRAAGVYPAHVERLQGFKADGRLQLVGTFADPQADGSMSVFATREDAEDFVAGDPFVSEGVVRSWTIKEWMESSDDL